MNWKGFGRDRSWHSPGGTEENHKENLRIFNVPAEGQRDFLKTSLDRYRMSACSATHVSSPRNARPPSAWTEVQNSVFLTTLTKPSPATFMFHCCVLNCDTRTSNGWFLCLCSHILKFMIFFWQALICCSFESYLTLSKFKNSSHFNVIVYHTQLIPFSTVKMELKYSSETSVSCITFH
jgi:hypothetical protein